MNKSDLSHLGTTTLNGVEITDLNSVYDAFEHLSEGYNDGRITHHGDVVKITYRNRNAQNFHVIRDSPHVYPASVYADGEGRQVIEVRERAGGDS